MTMTKDQAVAQVRQLRKQGVTWPNIEKHLRDAGYVSDRTGRPIKELAIRYMVDNAEREDRLDVRREEEEEKLFVLESDHAFKDNVKALMSVEGFTPEIRLKLLQVLIENSYTSKVLTNHSGPGASKSL